MDQFASSETLIIGLLIVASVVAMAVRRLRVPYTVALVLVGLLIGWLSPREINLTPELILGLFVPPLVFEAAFRLNLRLLARNLPFILLLAVPGVVLCTILVAVTVNLGAGVGLGAAIVFGALVSATDPVSVVAIFRAFSVHPRLALLVEGESLLNDGTAIVVFNLALASLLSGTFSLPQGIAEFVLVSVGGVAVGAGLGWLVSRVIAQIDDHLIEITLTTVLAFGAYLLAEHFHVSGVLAVVAAGLVCGSLGPRSMSPTTRIVLNDFWDYVAFLANSMVFLLIGLQVNVPSLLTFWHPVAWAIAGVLAARLVIVYGLGWLNNRLLEPMPFRWLHVINWGGLRGAICLALALSLPASMGPERNLLRVMAFGVVLFTLLVQGTTMGPLLRRLRINVRSESQIAYETQNARLTASRAAQARLKELHREGMISVHVWENLEPELAAQVTDLAEVVRTVLRSDPVLEAAEIEMARRELLHAQRSAYLDLRRDGLLSEEIFEQLVADVDAELVAGEQPAISPEGGIDQEDDPIAKIAKRLHR